MLLYIDDEGKEVWLQRCQAGQIPLPRHSNVLNGERICYTTLEVRVNELGT
jgi:hypothetical protein